MAYFRVMTDGRIITGQEAATFTKMRMTWATGKGHRTVGPPPGAVATPTGTDNLAIEEEECPRDCTTVT